MVKMTTLTTRSPRMMRWMKKFVKDKRPGPKDVESGEGPQDQVSRRLNSRVAGEGPQDPVSRRLNSRVAGEGPQDPVSRRLNSRVAGEGPQDPVSWRFNIVQPPYFLEPQKLTMNRMSQFCKVNSGSTEKVLLRNSSKYTAIIDMDEREDKAVRKASQSPGSHWQVERSRQSSGHWEHWQDRRSGHQGDSRMPSR